MSVRNRLAARSITAFDGSRPPTVRPGARPTKSASAGLAAEADIESPVARRQVEGQDGATVDPSVSDVQPGGYGAGGADMAAAQLPRHAPSIVLMAVGNLGCQRECTDGLAVLRRPDLESTSRWWLIKRRDPHRQSTVD